MLRFEAVSKTYADGTAALHGVTAAVAQGEILALVGGSGCGKTTLLRLIAGLDRPSRGRIVLDEETIAEPRADVGVIFQEPRLFPWLSVAENVGFGLDGRTKAQRAGLVDHGSRWPRELSGGQQQRVAIARALVPGPKLLLMDEPFSALDATTRAGLHEHLLALWSESRPTVVMVTHDVEDAVTLADRIIVMQPRPGRIFDSFDNPLARPRDRLSPAFEAQKREVLRSLDRSLRNEAPNQNRAAQTAGMWW
jgi:sulfonate transport system ATP-binding protein